MKVICKYAKECSISHCPHIEEHEYDSGCICYCYKEQQWVGCIPVVNESFKVTKDINLYSLANSNIDGNIIKEIIKEKIPCDISKDYIITSDKRIYKYIDHLFENDFVIVLSR